MNDVEGRRDLSNWSNYDHMRLEEGEFGSPGYHLSFTFCSHSPPLVLRSYDGAASLVAVSGRQQALLRVRHYTGAS